MASESSPLARISFPLWRNPGLSSSLLCRGSAPGVPRVLFLCHVGICALSIWKLIAIQFWEIVVCCFFEKVLLSTFCSLSDSLMGRMVDFLEWALESHDNCLCNSALSYCTKACLAPFLWWDVLWEQRSLDHQAALSAPSWVGLFSSDLWDHLVPSEEYFPGPACGAPAGPSAFWRCTGEGASVSFLVLLYFFIVVT